MRSLVLSSCKGTLPVAEARIDLTPPRGFHLFTKAKEDGSFAFDDLEPGEYGIEASMKMTLMRAKGRASVAAGETAEVSITIPVPRIIRVRVVDGDRGVAGARIEIISADPQVTTGPDGAFSFPASAAREYWLRVDLREKGGVFQCESWPIEGRDGIVLSIEKENLVAGRVTDPQGRPLPRVEIALRAERVPLSGRREDPQG